MGDPADRLKNYNGNIPRILALARLVILFAIGATLIMDSVFGNGSVDRVIELTVGLILVGIVPVDVLLVRFIGRHTKE